ncbi:uroporphyrinogen-III decarboxylase [Desulfosporosinus orientis DSM 765]|uniref:Uroporphyrinogen-III decarboxylase n=1 Tax=Desulfosporosinus orientis (strain ATCC 19365 / DSM 765 / NCIMB 8382 / VKM B-1628 / Singapore I) TaxID=768706 RepID=G7WGI3_DESOD|nr:uroporphyrinogen decarboxylase family protein [Desulfosporosinus orientis]AET68060.1 uroporphyrinogen-III decarboxylase [Desulfosporosinus orientis DSM 765]
MEIKQDLMTPKERMQAFAQGKPTDRIPCNPIMGETLSSLIGRTTYEVYHDPEVYADLEIALFRKFRHDAVGVGIGLREVAEAMGTKVIYPPNNISYVAEPALKDIRDVAKLSPVNPYQDGKIPIRLIALKMTRDALFKEVNVSCGIPGPFTTASGLLGTENLLKALIKYPEKVHELMEIIVESNFRIIDIAAEMGVGIGIADPISSSTIISKKFFQIFSMPYVEKCIDRIKQKTGGGMSIHVCGKSKKIWGDLVEIGITSLSIDDIEDLEDAKNAVGDKVCLVGNVPPVDIVRNGTYEDVVRESKFCIKKAHDNPKGFILSTGCQIPMNAPIENIQALLDTARSYGVYPVKPELWE